MEQRVDGSTVEFWAGGPARASLFLQRSDDAQEALWLLDFPVWKHKHTLRSNTHTALLFSMAEKSTVPISSST